MTILTALQRGSPSRDPKSPIDLALAGQTRYPRHELVSRLLAGTLPADYDQRELLLMLELATGWLARDVRPRVVITPELKVLWCNHSATAMLIPPQPVFLHQNSLCLSPTVDAEPFHRFLAGLEAAVERCLVNDPAVERGILLSGWAIKRQEVSLIFLEFVLRELPLDSHNSGMATQFGLTNAECDVIDILARMESAQAIATQLHVSVNTIRTHIRRIYSKLGITNQMQLMRTIVAYCGG